jgi:NAD(P)-dependent dehydrogenase (short-subunit alcohol dehydrogenase family)
LHVPSAELEGEVALVTGGGRGIGANIARELASAGMRVAVSARTREEVERVARELDGLAVVADVSRQTDVERMTEEVEQSLGPIDLLVANAGIDAFDQAAWDRDVDEWWHVHEVNVLGVYLCCRAVLPSMLERGQGRIVITGSGAAYLPGSTNSAYSSSKAAVCRFGETLANQLAGRVPVFPISPGLVRTEMTDRLPVDAPWTPPESAPRLVRALASGRFDRLSGRYLHAEHDPPEELEQRIDRILDDDLNAIRLRREP